MAHIRSNAKRRHISWVALVLAFFTIYALGADELAPVANHPAAEDFILNGLDGNAHQLSDHAGKVVLVSFWATWCPECIFEMPSLQALSKALPNDEFIILGINVGEDQKLVRSFVEEHRVTFPILLDHDLAVYKKWPVLGVPTSFVINQQGKIVYSVIGAIEWLSPATISKIGGLTDSEKS